jgi:hypothetical protein
MPSTPPPTKPSFDAVAEMISSIQQQMESLNPARLQGGDGVQLDFDEAVEEDSDFRIPYGASDWVWRQRLRRKM